MLGISPTERPVWPLSMATIVHRGPSVFYNRAAKSILLNMLLIESAVVQTILSVPGALEGTRRRPKAADTCLPALTLVGEWETATAAIIKTGDDSIASSGGS